MAQIKHRASDGTWKNPKTIRTWDGSQWRQRKGYEWNGSMWIPIISYKSHIVKDGVPQGFTFSNTGFGNHKVSTTSGTLQFYVGPYTEDDTSDLASRSSITFDLTQYRTLYLDWESIGTSGNSQFEMRVGSWVGTTSLRVWRPGTRRTEAVDVSGISGQHTAVVLMYLSGTYDSAWINIYNAWFE